MKNILTLSCTILLCAMNCAAQHYNWITGGGSTESMISSFTWENVTGTCVDENGNLYVLATVGSSDIRADTFFDLSAHNTLSSNSHVLLASYKCDGTMRWAKLIESNNNTFVNNQTTGVGNQDIAYYNGSIYMAGAFYGGTKYIGNDTSFTSFASSFTARFDTLGHFRWVRMIGPDSATTTSLTGYPGIVSFDKNGYLHNFNFIKGGLHLNSSFTAAVTGTYDLKYDTSGDLLAVTRVALDSVWFLSKAIFNTQSTKYYGILSLNSSYWYTYYPNQNSAVCAFQANGTPLWMDTTGANGLILGMSFDHKNGIYACGNGFDTFSFGGLTVANTIFPAYYSFAPIIKLDTNGHGQWLYNLQSNESVDILYDITCLANGHIAATGELAGLSVHGTDTIISTAGEQSNPLFMEIDSAGRTLKLDQFHGPGNNEWGSCITSDRGSNVYVGGMLDVTMTATGVSTYTTNGGNTDFFVIKYGYNDCDTLLSLHTPSDPLASNQGPIYVYPNPATEDLNIVGVSAESTFQIVDMTGKQLKNGTLQAGPNTVSTKNMSPGMYLLEIMQKDGTKQIVRLVIE